MQTSPITDPITSGAWQENHQKDYLYITDMTWQGKAKIDPRSPALSLNTDTLPQHQWGTTLSFAQHCGNSYYCGATSLSLTVSHSDLKMGEKQTNKKCWDNTYFVWQKSQCHWSKSLSLSLSHTHTHIHTHTHTHTHTPHHTPCLCCTKLSEILFQNKTKNDSVWVGTPADSTGNAPATHSSKKWKGRRNDQVRKYQENTNSFVCTAPLTVKQEKQWQSHNITQTLLIWSVYLVYQ